jgi:hypothetical protein
MNRSVQLYIEGQRIELFQDEAIQVTSSIQNVQDLSKTYTDFSQGFTVPASSHNNAIFEHWYQSDVNATNDPNIRRDAYIEIDLTTFRKGKIQLEGAVITNGKPSAYNITFFGEGVTLKDLFGEDLLSDLDYTALSHDFTSNEVKARIEDNTNAYDVKWPLITSNRIWEYQSTPVNIPLPNWLVATITQNDIHTTSGAIRKDELFPAVRVTKVIEAIESKYGITFNGTFLNDERFTKLFLWFKGKETLVKTSYGYELSSTSVVPTFTNYDLTSYYTSATNTINFQELPAVLTHRLIYNITATTSSENYFIDIYQNGNLYNTITGFGTGTYTLADVAQVVGLDVDYTFKIRTEGNNTIDSNLVYEVDYITTGSVNTDYLTVTYSSLSMSLQLDLSANAPVMKIADFLKGIMLMFNMTIYSIKDNEYWLEPLDDWYSKGAVIDITSFTDVTSIEHNRMPLYKKIQFKFQDSECFLNTNFSQTYNRNYGDTTYQYNYDGGEFTIEVPFENLLQTKYNGTQDLQLGYSLNGSFAPYVPKPVLFYQYDNQVTDFKYENDGGGHSTITTYTPFGQDLLYNGNDVTLNFAPETSTLLNTPIQVTGFSQYYFSYLYNLYNLKQRLVNVKTNLPTSLVTGLQLNDRLVIRDKRYIINEMKTNLSTGDVDLQLILDFRPVINSTQTTPVVSPNGGDVLIPVILDNNATQIGLSSSISDVSFSHSIVYEERMVTVTIGASNVEFTMITESGDILASERAEQITTEGEESRLIDVSLTSTYPDGSTSRRTIYIIQQ